MTYQLRPISESDQATLLIWRNSDRIRENMYTDHIISQKEHDIWFHKILIDQSVNYQICEFQGKPVGLIYMTQIDSNNNKCNWGFYLGEENCPRKSGPIMELLALEYAFDNLEIRKLCCEVLSFNKSIVKLHQKFGFKQEGCLQEHVLKRNNYIDVILLALFKDDWILKRNGLKKLLF